MTSVLPIASRPLVPPVLDQDVELACQRIAPAWPLDRFLAVNPYWGHRDQPFATAAAELGALCGATLWMPRAYHREQWRQGRLGREHLQAAIDAEGAGCTVDELIAAMQGETPVAAPLPLVTDLADRNRRPSEPQRWTDLAVHQISQHAAAYFDRTQSSWGPDRGLGLYGSWRRSLAQDRGLPMRAGHAAFARRVQALPANARDALAVATRSLGVEPPQRAAYYTALLASVRGWAAWCAYQRWQARLAGGDDGHIVDLLAIRIAWELLLVQDEELQPVLPAWRERLAAHPAAAARLAWAQAHDRLLQRALEIAFQQRLGAGLRRGPEPASPPPTVQAVFCIDVRSERFRRALEAEGGDAVQTRGFAGFFGLPIAHAPLGGATVRPQLPGLLAPAQTTTQSSGDAALDGALAARRQGALRWRQRWSEFRAGATSAFTFVESCGLLYGVDLLRRSLGAAAPPARAFEFGLEPRQAARLRPAWGSGSVAADPAQRIELAHTVLRAMGLLRPQARLVLLAGHGSSSANNPHAAGLDCGACGGQTGEVNARLLARLLNEPAVRDGLRRRGVDVAAATWFVAGLHDTTTDELRLFDEDEVPAGHAAELQQLRAWLARAGERTRAERAPSLGLGHLQGEPRALARALRRRAADWAQVRPEWGLADNAAFVVAPRWRTRHLDLGGRVFLHDYDWRADEGFPVLTLILTAPMVVTNWINLQYHASTVDNRRFGSGNKVLHNVVGGSIGVFEGNGGDLRPGLPLQSLHDGQQWRHTPLRLSVFVAAPAAAIDGILAAHETVRQLVDNGWLHLFRIDDEGHAHARKAGGGWSPMPTGG
ncbi:MAG: DUF2309 domain-containing protein [Planctomycetes bacterium]|nr:DUF2309 domain-containing protein [Planctomycetota bacterium]